MKLQIGESKTTKLPFWLKGVDFKCENNSLSLDRQGDFAVLRVWSGNRKNVLAAVMLGRVQDVNQFGMTVKIHSQSRWLVSVGSMRLVIDYGAKKAATNVLGQVILGSAQWGENVQIPWRADFLPLFGLPQPPEELDRNTAEVFWKWFHGTETDIIRLLGGTKQESKAVFRQMNLWLCPVFPRFKGKQMNFDLRCKGEENLFIIRCGNDELLKADAEEFANMLPEPLKEQWKVIVTE